MSFSTQHPGSNKRVRRGKSSSRKRQTVRTARKPSQVSETLCEDRTINQVSRPWPTSPHQLCSYGFCKRFDIIDRCTLLFSTSAGEAATGNSSLITTSTPSPSALILDHQTAWSPCDFRDDMNNPGYPHDKVRPDSSQWDHSRPVPGTTAFTPTERFVTERMTSQPFNNIASFIAFPTITTASSPLPSLIEHQGNMSGSVVAHNSGSYGPAEHNLQSGKN